MKRIAACLLVAPFVSSPAGAADPAPEHRRPVARLIGTGSGTSTGSAGEASLLEPLPGSSVPLVFALAPPGQPWRICSRSQFRRTSR